MIVRLDSTHLEECLDIVFLKENTTSALPITREELKKRFLGYFANSNKHFAFGNIENNQVNSFILFSFRENKTRGRFWALIGFYSKNFKNFFTFKNSEYELLLRHVIDFAEKNNYNQFYYAVLKRRATAFNTQWNKSELSKSENYQVYDAEIIPPMTQPTSELYWKLMGQQLRSCEVIIKHRIRK